MSSSVNWSTSHTYLHDLEGLDFAGVLNVRASAEIDKGTATVDGATLAGDKLINIVQLVFAVCEHLLEVLFGNIQTVEALLLLEDTCSLSVKCLPVRLLDNLSVSPYILALTPS